MTTATEFETTGIGSLPHHNVDAALEHAFRASIPYLPQIPIRKPKEFMVGQALAGFPGLLLNTDGSVALNLDQWAAGAHLFNRKLEKAFAESAQSASAFEYFEPTADSWAAWKPFLWELQEREIKHAKIQIAGPLTCQWALRLDQNLSEKQRSEITTQIFRLVLARSIAMVRKLRSIGVETLLFLDEPGLSVQTFSTARQWMALQELKVAIQTLKKENAQVGIHCCSNTVWSSVLTTEPNYLSIDAGLSLKGLLAQDEAFKAFRAKGGKLSLGVVPTSKRSDELHDLSADTLAKSLLSTLSEVPEGKSLLLDSIYTPACGLALHSPVDAEWVWKLTEDIVKKLKLELRN